MPEDFIDPGGEVVRPEQLQLPRAVAVAAAVTSPRSYASLVECRSEDEAETVVFEVEVERPQRPVHDVLRVERIAARFYRTDDPLPEALALREDFPVVPHFNMIGEVTPRCLCLYDQPWEEVKPGWTGASFVERVRWWLADTARDVLHGGEQPLEPLMFSHGFDLVVASTFGLESGPTSEITRMVLVNGEEGRVIVADDENGPNRGGQLCLTLYIETPVRQHGVIQRTPKTLGEVAELVDNGGFRLIDQLRGTVRELPDEIRLDRGRRQSLRPLVVLGLPKTRGSGGSVEWVELKGFLCTDSLEAVGDRIDAWKVHGEEIGHPLVVDAGSDGSDIGIIVVNVVRRLSWRKAARYSGLRNRDGRRIAAVGVGALGSQVAMNLARAGFGNWTLIDDDAFMPHNAVRHSLVGGFEVGNNKALCVAFSMNRLADDDPIATSIPANYLRPGKHQDLVEKAMNEAELVLDMSASVPVARMLASQDFPGRAVSIFLSPTGLDLVVLAEDLGRTTRLDDLEMLYYAGVAMTKELDGHLRAPGGRTRYGTGCRDVSMQMAQTQVGTHAGIGASAVKQAVQTETATARVWRIDPVSLGVNPVEISVEPIHEQQQHGWSARLSRGLLRDLIAQRMSRLPNETGGILIGGIDHDQRCVYVLLALPSPSDSEEWPTMYIRGVHDLRRERDRIVDETAGNLDYLGEWHSHPPGVPTVPSADDRQVFQWISELVVADGRPPIMLICGDDGIRVFVESLGDPFPEPICLQ